MSQRTAPIAFRTAVFYWLVGVAWILVSDEALQYFLTDPALLSQAQLYKGWAFVTVTAALLYLVLRAQLHHWRVEALRREQAERRYREVVESSNDAIFIHRGGRIVYANPALVRLLRAGSVAAVLGKTPFEIIQPEDHAAVQTRIEQMKVTCGGVGALEARFVRLDGTTVTVEVSASPMLDQGETAIHVTARDISDRKRAEAAVQERLKLETQLTRLTDSAPGAIHSFQLRPDGSTSFPFANLRIEEITGVSREELARDGAILRELIHPDDLGRIGEAVTRSAEQLSLFNEQYRLLHPTRGRIWIEARSIPEREPDGGTLWHGILIDITRRKEAEEASRTSEERLRLAAEAANMGYWESDLRRGKIYWSESLERIHGYAPGGFPGTFEAFRERVHPDDRGRLDEARERALVTDGEYQVELRFRRADDGVRWGLVRGKLFFDAAGKPERMVGIELDITERKQMEAEVARHAYLLRAVVEGTTDAVFAKDREGRYLLVNEAGARFIQQTPAYILGKDDRQLFAEASARIIREHDAAVMAAGQPQTNEEELTSGGITRTYMATKAPLRNERGEVVGIVGVSRDITDLKLADRRLRESEERLRLANEAAGIGTYSVDYERGLLLRSPELDVLLGLPSERELTLGEGFSLVHPEDVPALRAADDRARDPAGDGRLRIELRFLRPGGEVRWVTFSGQTSFQDTPDGRVPVSQVGAVQDITARKEGELAVQRRLELEQQLTRLASTAPGAIYTFRVAPDGSSAFPYASAKFEDTFGLRPGQLGESAAPAFAMIHSEDLARVQASIQESARTLTPWHTIFRVSHPQRGLLWIEGSSVPQAEPDGAVVWHGFLLDITQRKLAEERLRQSDERLRLLISGIREHAIYLLTAEGRVASWYHGAQQIKGYAEEEILGQHLSIFYTPEDLAAGIPQQALEQAAAEGSFEQEGWRVRKDGSRFWASSMLTAVYDERRLLRGFTNITHDLSRRKQVEAALEQERQRMSAIINSAMDGIITIDQEQRVIVFNPAAERMFQCPAADVLGNPIEKFIPERHRAAHATHVREFGATGVSTRTMGNFGSITGRRSTGEEFPMEASISQVELDGQKLFTVTCRDITERVQAEELRKSLEGQLMQAQKMDAMGTLAGGIAHDFNNILTTILGNVELARWDVGSPAVVEASLAEISQAAMRAKNLVRQILTFSRQQPQDRAVISLAPVVEECVSLLRASFPAGVELRRLIRPNLPTVLADATQIHQVILNLCTNAWHSLGDGHGVIEIILEPVEISAEQAATVRDLHAGSYVRLAVRDTGQGMDDVIRARIFEPFFTTKPTGQGTGLGLSVVHGIVKSHEGAIAVQTQPGAGTTFELFLPVVAAGEVAEIRQRFASHRGRGERVLYIDDEEQLIAMAARMLERLGYQAETYRRAEPAIAAFAAAPGRYDVVITDFNLPGISGLEVARELRRIRADIPVILNSGFISEELHQRAREAGIGQIMQKPNTAEELSEALKLELAGRDA
jgi:PAS domain S-box-containing protein